MTDKPTVEIWFTEEASLRTVRTPVIAELKDGAQRAHINCPADHKSVLARVVKWRHMTEAEAHAYRVRQAATGRRGWRANRIL